MNYWSRSLLDHVCIMLFCIFGIPVGPPVSCKLNTTFYNSTLTKSTMLRVGQSWHLKWKRPLSMCGAVYVLWKIPLCEQNRQGYHIANIHIEVFIIALIQAQGFHLLLRYGCLGNLMKWICCGWGMEAFIRTTWGEMLFWKSPVISS